MSAIPYDIWTLVASYIPQRDLLKLISVNRAFFNIVLDERYKEIYWVKPDKQMFRDLERLQDPLVVYRVRRLHIRAWYIQHLLSRDAILEGSVAQKMKGWLSKRLTAEQPAVQPQSFDNTLSPRQIINSMIQAVNGMVNLTEYDFEWRDLPLDKDTQIFLTSARDAFGSTLTKLSLRAELPWFEKFLSITGFNRLEELQLNFDYDASNSPTHTSKNAHTSTFIFITSFINQIGSSLRYLSISSSSEADLSPFFQALATFSALRSIAICIAFDNKHLSDPSGLSQFLRAHGRQLAELELSPNSSSQVASWSSVCQNDLSYLAFISMLKSLTIRFGPPQPAIIKIVRKNVLSLTTLSLMGRFLSHYEAMELIDLFAGRSYRDSLQRIHLEVKVLNLELFDILAERFPNLFSLVLVYDAVSPDFRDNYSMHSYPDWILYNLSLFRERSSEAINKTYAVEEQELMNKMASRIPKLRSFKGWGHMKFNRFRFFTALPAAVFVRLLPPHQQSS